MDTLVVNGTVVTAADAFRADVRVAGGRIAEIGEGLPRAGAEVIDAAGCYVMPGGVDVHTHLALEVDGERVSDGFFHGTVAAACGGTTCVVEHPGFGPEGCDPLEPVVRCRERAEGEAAVDYGLHGVAQSADPRALGRLRDLVAAGIPTVKAYLTYSGRLEDAELLRVLETMAGAGGLTAVHAENHAIVQHLTGRLRQGDPSDPALHPRSRPAYCEAEAVARAVALARAAGDAPLYIVHLSTADGLAAVERARAGGLPVLVETCPQYLLLTEERYAEPDHRGLRYVMSPPLRSPEDRDALWRGLGDGAIDVVATDHCSFGFARKLARGREDVFRCPGGIPGVETRLPLLFSEGVLKGRIDLTHFVDLVATAPARIMGLHPRKGTIAPGADADLVIWDPGAEKVLSAGALHQKVDYTPFEGMRVRGWPRTVMLRGKIIVHEGRFVGRRGQGRYVERRLPAPGAAPVAPGPLAARRRT